MKISSVHEREAYCMTYIRVLNARIGVRNSSRTTCAGNVRAVPSLRVGQDRDYLQELSLLQFKIAFLKVAPR